MAALPALSADDFRRDPSALADALRTHGACWIAGWPDAGLRDALRQDLQRLQTAGELSPAAVGRSDGRALRSDIRADATRWLDDPRCGDAARTFLVQLDDVRALLNRSLYLGLTECEAHYAAYLPGGGYARHRDRFRDSDARVVSWVSYLNPDDWSQHDGGALRLYAGEESVDLPPTGGSVCFLSELEHEVLPTNRERLSIAAWFRRAPVALI
jgi:SM-20-related protein